MMRVGRGNNNLRKQLFSSVGRQVPRSLFALLARLGGTGGTGGRGESARYKKMGVGGGNRFPFGWTCLGVVRILGIKWPPPGLLLLCVARVCAGIRWPSGLHHDAMVWSAL